MEAQKPRIELFMTDILQEFHPGTIQQPKAWDNWLNVWISDWKTVWSTDWKTPWMTDWKFDWKTVWSNDWLNVWMNDWKFDWKTVWSNDWLNVWMNDWKFDWNRVWTTNFMKRSEDEDKEPGDATGACGENSFDFLLVRSEEFGGLVHDAVSSRVFMVNDVGLRTVEHLKTGRTIEETAKLLTISYGDIVQMLCFMEEHGTEVCWEKVDGQNRD